MSLQIRSQQIATDAANAALGKGFGTVGGCCKDIANAAYYVTKATAGVVVFGTLVTVAAGAGAVSCGAKIVNVSSAAPAVVQYSKQTVAELVDSFVDIDIARPAAVHIVDVDDDTVLMSKM